MQRQKIHLYQKLMLILLITIGPICLLSIFSSRDEQRLILQTMTESLQSKTTFYEAMISSEVERLQSSTYAYINDEEFVKISVLSDVLSDYQRNELINNMRKKMNLLRSMSPYIENICVYIPTLGRSVNAINCDYEIMPGEVDAIKHPSSNEGYVIYYEGKLLVRSAYPNGGSLKVYPSLLLAVEINQQAVLDILSNIETMQDGGTVLISDDWALSSGTETEQDLEALRLLLPDKTMTHSATFTAHWKGENHLLASQYSAQMGAYLVSFIPQRVVLLKLQTLRHWTIVLLIAAIVLILGAAVLEYHSVHLPIQRMVNAFEKVEGGSFDVRLTTEKRDEFQYLYTRFNHMMDTIKDLIRQVYQQKILFQQAQLKQLQSQINPHFFYNSFFAAQGMVDMGQTEAASQMLENLGRYFHFITRSGAEYVTLEREAAHARAYCEIQKMRFSQVSVRFDDVPENLKTLLVPRLILQPLLENAYIHGLEDFEGQGKLSVFFEDTDEKVYIHVINNGQSMSVAALDDLQKKLQEPLDAPMETTGIVNIHRRLLLYYGPPCGLEVASLEPRGTHIRMCLTKSRRDEHVPPVGG
jgi:two-component system sensor histidine kinase YesM